MCRTSPSRAGPGAAAASSPLPPTCWPPAGMRCASRSPPDPSSADRDARRRAQRAARNAVGRPLRRVGASAAQHRADQCLRPDDGATARLARRRTRRRATSRRRRHRLSLQGARRERRNRPHDRRLGRLPRLSPSEFVPGESAQAGTGRLLVQNGRRFLLSVTSASMPPAADALAEANSALASLAVEAGDFYPGTVEPATFAAADGWTTGNGGSVEVEPGGYGTAQLGVHHAVPGHPGLAPAARNARAPATEGIVLTVWLWTPGRGVPKASDRIRVEDGKLEQSWEGQMRDFPRYRILMTKPGAVQRRPLDLLRPARADRITARPARRPSSTASSFPTGAASEPSRACRTRASGLLPPALELCLLDREVVRRARLHTDAGQRERIFDVQRLTARIRLRA